MGGSNLHSRRRKEDERDSDGDQRRLYGGCRPVKHGSLKNAASGPMRDRWRKRATKEGCGDSGAVAVVVVLVTALVVNRCD